MAASGTILYDMPQFPDDYRPDVTAHAREPGARCPLEAWRPRHNLLMEAPSPHCLELEGTHRAVLKLACGGVQENHS